MRRLIMLVAVPFLALGLACAGLDPAALQGQAPPDPTWVGVWAGPETTLVIHPDGMVELSRRGSAETHVVAPAQRFTTTEIAVGIGPFVQTVHIDQPPTQTPTGWTLVVDGTTLHRTLDVAPLDPPPGLPPQPGAP